MTNDMLDRAQHHLPAALELLGHLVAMDTGTGQAAGILRAGGMLASALEQLGFAVEAVPAAEYGQHLVARRRGEGRPILILGHLDTVCPAGAARQPERAGDQLSGPGIYDCKGGLVLGLTACRIWTETVWPSCPVTFIINADEEVGSLSSRALIESEAAKSGAVLVVEPAPAPNLVITARKGIGRYVLRVFGRAAHAGADRETGISALQDLAAKILALEELNAQGGGFSVTVGTAAGGVRPNVVPDYAQAEIDLRLSHPDQIPAAEAALRLASSVSRVAGAKYRLEGGITRPPMPETPASLKLFALAREAGSSVGLALAGASSGGGSDANFCAALGIPVLDGLGPAGAGAHAEHEHILVSSFAPRVALLCALGRRLGG